MRQHPVGGIGMRADGCSQVKEKGRPLQLLPTDMVRVQVSIECNQRWMDGFSGIAALFTIRGIVGQIVGHNAFKGTH